MPFLRKRVRPAMTYGDWLYIVALCNYANRQLVEQELTSIRPDAFTGISNEQLQQLVMEFTQELEGLA